MPSRTLPRRTFLQGLAAGGAAVRVGLPPLACMFNSAGTAYAARSDPNGDGKPETRFVFWFNGNGIPERYWIPRDEGTEYSLTPCLAPLARLQGDIQILSGLDNPNGQTSGVGNGHQRSMSALVSGSKYTGMGAGSASIDQVVAAKIGADSRFPSLQIGVCQESFGSSMQRNMSWSAKNRALAPELVPQKLFDRLFGRLDEGWVSRKRSVLDVVRQQAQRLSSGLGQEDSRRIDEYLTSIFDIERAIADFPEEYAQQVDEPEAGGDPRDYPRIAKLQSDLLVHAFASGQTRVASYMLTKCQSLTRFPWLGLSFARHHEYSHLGGSHRQRQQEVMRDICRWHVEEFAYLVALLKSVPEGSGTLLDNSALLFVHEHAEANFHKNSGGAVILAGRAGRLNPGHHTRVTGTFGDLYRTVAKEVGAPLDHFPTSYGTMPAATA